MHVNNTNSVKMWLSTFIHLHTPPIVSLLIIILNIRNFNFFFIIKCIINVRYGSKILEQVLSVSWIAEKVLVSHINAKYKFIYFKIIFFLKRICFKYNITDITNLINRSSEDVYVRHTAVTGHTYRVHLTATRWQNLVFMGKWNTILHYYK